MILASVKKMVNVASIALDLLCFHCVITSKVEVIMITVKVTTLKAKVKVNHDK